GWQRLWVPDEGGQTHDKLAAAARSFAERSDRPAVQVHQAPNERQTDAQPALRAFEGLIHLREHVEHLWQHGGRNAEAGVFHRYHDLFTVPLRSQPDAAAVLGVPGG